MNARLKRIFIGTLMCSAATIPAAMAQTDQQQQTAAGQECQELTRVADENRKRFQKAWLDNADAAVKRANPQECASYVEQAELAIEKAEVSGDATGQIVVTQPEPTVTVEQASPEVTVDQAEPQVTVNQGQPEIIVRQAQPTVRVQMPQPTITIDQPEPEIIVRMPEPDVAVSMAEPQVSVQQPQPEVSVEQAKPQVDVQLEPEVSVARQDAAQVQVQQNKPVVRRSETQAQAEVKVEQQQPRVSFERAKPKVEFESAGEPQVKFTESGEPNIRVEQAGEQDQAAASRQDGSEQQNATAQQQSTEADQQSATGQQDRTQQQSAAATQQPAEADQQQSAAATQQIDPQETASTGGDRYQRLRGDGSQASAETPAVDIAVSEIVGRDVVNHRDEELGTISRVVTAGDRNYAVLANGGFLGLGEREVALPLDRMAVSSGQDEIVMRGMTDEEIEAMPEFDAGEAQELQATQEVKVGRL